MMVVSGLEEFVRSRNISAPSHNVKLWGVAGERQVKLQYGSIKKSDSR